MIGILAGMGPRSTAPFIEKIVEMCQVRHGARNDMDFPPMMIYSCPTPFYLGQAVDHSLMQRAILAGITRLAATGVSYIAIPCNLAHVYFESIRQSVDTPVLDMVQETLSFLPMDCRRVAVLATAATIESEIYQKGLAASNREYIGMLRWQTAVDQILSEIKCGAVTEKTRRLWQDLMHDINKTASAAIIACTDLNIVADKENASLITIDSSTCLAQAVVDRFYKRSE